MAETYTNWSTTTLSSAITSALQFTINVTDASGFPTSGDFRIKIGSEILVVTAVSGTTWTVTRGAESTTATTYATGTNVVPILTAGALTGIRAAMHQSGAVSGTDTVSGVIKPGDLFFPNDSHYTVVRWTPPGGWMYYLNGRQMTPPLASSFSPYYTGSSLLGLPTLTNTGGSTGALVLQHPSMQSATTASTTSHPMYTYSVGVPATTPYSITTAILPGLSSVAGFAGFGFLESSTGKQVLFGVNSARFLRLYKWTNSTTTSTDYYNLLGVMQQHGSAVWLRLTDTGTSLQYSISVNSVNWTVLQSTTRTDFFTVAPDNIVLAVGDSSVANTPGGCTYLTWEIR